MYESLPSELLRLIFSFLFPLHHNNNNTSNSHNNNNHSDNNNNSDNIYTLFQGEKYQFLYPLPFDQGFNARKEENYYKWFEKEKKHNFIIQWFKFSHINKKCKDLIKNEIISGIFIDGFICILFSLKDFLLQYGLIDEKNYLIGSVNVDDLIYYNEMFFEFLNGFCNVKNCVKHLELDCAFIFYNLQNNLQNTLQNYSIMERYIKECQSLEYLSLNFNSFDESIINNINFENNLLNLQNVEINFKKLKKLKIVIEGKLNDQSKIYLLKIIDNFCKFSTNLKEIQFSSDISYNFFSFLNKNSDELFNDIINLINLNNKKEIKITGWDTSLNGKFLFINNNTLQNSDVYNLQNSTLQSNLEEFTLVSKGDPQFLNNFNVTNYLQSETFIQGDNDFIPYNDNNTTLNNLQNNLNENLFKNLKILNIYDNYGSVTSSYPLGILHINGLLPFLEELSIILWRPINRQTIVDLTNLKAPKLRSLKAWYMSLFFPPISNNSSTTSSITNSTKLFFNNSLKEISISCDEMDSSILSHWIKENDGSLRKLILRTDIKVNSEEDVLNEVFNISCSSLEELVFYCPQFDRLNINCLNLQYLKLELKYIKSIELEAPKLRETEINYVKFIHDLTDKEFLIMNNKNIKSFYPFWKTPKIVKIEVPMYISQKLETFEYIDDEMMKNLKDILLNFTIRQPQNQELILSNSFPLLKRLENITQLNKQQDCNIDLGITFEGKTLLDLVQTNYVWSINSNYNGEKDENNNCSWLEILQQEQQEMQTNRNNIYNYTSSYLKQLSFVIMPKNTKPITLRLETENLEQLIVNNYSLQLEKIIFKPTITFQNLKKILLVTPSPFHFNLNQFPNLTHFTIYGNLPLYKERNVELNSKLILTERHLNLKVIHISAMMYLLIDLMLDTPHLRKLYVKQLVVEEIPKIKFVNCPVLVIKEVDGKILTKDKKVVGEGVEFALQFKGSSNDQAGIVTLN
ncbi:hypothetical protein ABK040_012056 [Willaertia magna]